MDWQEYEAQAARAIGASVVTGVRVDQVLVRSGRVAGVATSHGDVAAGALLLATNAWSPSLVPHIGANLTPIREHVCVTEPVPQMLSRAFETNQCNEYWRQLRTGEILKSCNGQEAPRSLAVLHDAADAKRVIEQLRVVAYAGVMLLGIEVIDDHVPLLQSGLRVIDVIDLTYPPHHTPNDTMDKISAKSLATVGDVATALVTRR